jgi:RNA polymerase sigma-70 factor (ECF subfamily)
MATFQSVPCEFDAAYIQGLRMRDPVKEAQFVTHFSHMLRNKLRKDSVCHNENGDVQQETLARVLAAVRSSSGIRSPERLGGFVASVCNNVRREFWRSRRRYESIEGIEDVLPGDLDPDVTLARCETTRHVQLVLSRLAVKNKHILQALFIDEKDRDEVCSELGVSRANLRVLLHRAKKEFRNEYKHISAR